MNVLVNSDFPPCCVCMRPTDQDRCSWTCLWLYYSIHHTH